MNEVKEVTTQSPETVREASETVKVIRPPVDIFEDEAGITVQADLPGVSKDRLSVHVDRNSLAIEGTIEIQAPEGVHLVYADVRSTRYQRGFSLSGELDGNKAEATLKDGILTLRIPKREQYQPRKIDVQTG
ncbi:MAG: Hsp20/alpha crystallin family protein [Methylococcaceae bacterium]|nr:Hsp20/alpha crystallin family protein [Methylococcaceae bacterium]